MVKEILLAGAGGFAGSALRYAVSAAVVSLPLQGGLPVGTFAVNAAGSLAIGVLAAAGRMAGVRHGGFLRRIHHFFRLLARNGEADAQRAGRDGCGLCGRQCNRMPAFCGSRPVAGRQTFPVRERGGCE